jgi:hypothetical protein
VTQIVINVPTERWPGILAEVVQIGKLLDRLNRDDLPDERIAAPAVRGRELTEIVATLARTPHSLAWCVLWIRPDACDRRLWSSAPVLGLSGGQIMEGQVSW